MTPRDIRPTLRSAASSAAALLALSACRPWPASDGYPYTTTDPVTDFAWASHDLYATITYVVLVIFVIVTALLAYTLVRFRDDGSPGNPVQIHGNIQMELGWTLLPVLIVIGLVVPTVRTVFEIGATAPQFSEKNGKPTVEIEVVGKRWWWEFRYVGTGVVTGNEMHVPDDRPVSLLITSDTVIHSFWVPRLGGKRDAVPGRVNRIWFNMTEDIKPGEPVTYPGECAEFCGEAHAYMRFYAVVHDGDEFDAWLEGMKKPTQFADASVKEKGEKAFTEGGCIGCHAITGMAAATGRQGPNLTQFGHRKMLAAGIVENTPENLAQWIRDPNSIKPGTTKEANPSRALDGMNIPVKLTEEQITDLVAYLQALK